MNENIYQNKPIHPDQLFNSLMTLNLQSMKCKCEEEEAMQEREVLIELINQYQRQIIEKKKELEKGMRLTQTKLRLLIQLQSLKEQRVIFDEKISRQIDRLRISPVEIRDRHKNEEEITVMKQKNIKIQVRIKQLIDYINKVEKHNIDLEKERKIIEVKDFHYYDQNQRNRLLSYRQEQDDFMREFRLRMRQRQEMAQRSVQMQENQIVQRNRIRLQGINNKFKYYVPVSDRY